MSCFENTSYQINEIYLTRCKKLWCVSVLVVSYEQLCDNGYSSKSNFHGQRVTQCNGFGQIRKASTTCGVNGSLNGFGQNRSMGGGITVWMVNDGVEIIVGQ